MKHRHGNSDKASRSESDLRHGRRSRRRGTRRNQRIVLTAFCWALVLIMLGLGVYTAIWYIDLGRIQRESERYASLYSGRTGTAQPTVSVEAHTATPTQAPTEAPSQTPAEAPTEAPTPQLTATPSEAPTQPPSQAPTQTPTETPAKSPTEAPSKAATKAPTQTPAQAPSQAPVEAPTRAPVQTFSPIPTKEPSPEPTLTRFGADLPVVEDEPIPTPGSDTLVYALPTAPPVQESFEALLALNPEAVGFLEIEGMLALPVSQRENDNEYYLNHTFEGAEAPEGALFLDGMNRLVPEDDCLIVYGHNMKNKTMFGKLSSYEDASYLRQHSVIRFDTLYENRSYVVFAAFVASMTPGNARYFDVRNFVFDEAGFDKFVLKLQGRSLYKSPIEVTYGDHLLLLVTCDYTRPEGRFILALRQLRADESETAVWAQALDTEKK